MPNLDAFALLDTALSHYDETLTTLEQATSTAWWKSRIQKSKVKKLIGQTFWLFGMGGLFTRYCTSSPSPQVVLSVLRSRDIVQAALKTTNEVSVETLLRIVQLDERLRKKANLIAETVPLADWRTSFDSPTQAWWWFLETTQHRLDRFDWLWNVLTLTSLTVSISLVVDISSRFLSGGPDVLGAFAVISQSVLTLLTVGSAFTGAGQTAVEKTLAKLGIRKYLWEEIKLVLSILLLVGLVSLRGCLPQFADYFNQRGLARPLGQSAEALSDYERAVSLNPNNLNAQYNLGRVYEDLQDLDKARTRYRIAMQGNFDAAYNDLGRLALQEKKLPEAAALLQQGLEFNKKSNNPETRYALLKNLGWVRLEQKRYNEAKSILKDAISLDKNFQTPDYPLPPADAHCLLAKVLQDKPVPENALDEWEKCQSYITNIRFPEEDTWRNLAKEKIDKADNRNHKLKE